MYNASACTAWSRKNALNERNDVEPGGVQMAIGNKQCVRHGKRVSEELVVHLSEKFL